MQRLPASAETYFRTILKSEQVLTKEEDLKNYGKDWTKHLPPPAPCIVLLPKTTEEVSSILRYCHEQALAVVPSGGRTGLAGGALASSGEIVLSLEKMNKILAIDPVGMMVRAEAGVITQQLQERVQEEGLFFALDLASKGSCQIGGNIATNAGGLKFIRYGGMREQVLGLVTVLADGRVLNTNLGLRKNNCGPDFNHLMVGSEGILGVITEATLRLTAKPASLDVALIGTDDMNSILQVLALCHQRGEKVTAFEFFDAKACAKVCECYPQIARPFPKMYRYYGLCEIEGAGEMGSKIEALLGEAFSSDMIEDAIIASSRQEFSNVWFFRENITESLAQLCLVHKNDLSIPIARLGDFQKALSELLSQFNTGVQIVSFGHIGDGNIHLNYIADKKQDPIAFKKECRNIEEKVFDLVKRFFGSISAEHGIGYLKKSDLKYCVSDLQVELLRQLKNLFDPKGILNPGKIL